jgi:hypothetical protein
MDSKVMTLMNSKVKGVQWIQEQWFQWIIRLWGSMDFWTMPSMDSRVGILKILKQWLQGMDLKTIFQ